MSGSKGQGPRWKEPVRVLRWLADVVSVGVVGYLAAVSDRLGLADGVAYLARALLLVAVVLVIRAIRKHGFDAAGLRMVASATYAVTAMVAACLMANSSIGLLGNQAAGFVLLLLWILTLIHIGSVGWRATGPFGPPTIALALLSGGLWFLLTFSVFVVTLIGD